MPFDATSQSGSLADRLQPLLREEKPRISLGEMVGRIEGDAGLGPILFVLTLPVMLPLPPGVSMVMALPILLVAPQIALGRKRLRLPAWLGGRSVKHAELVNLLKRVQPPLRRIERLVRPRLSPLTGRVGGALVGVACTVLGLILVLPLPFANLLPSWSLASLALGLTRRDGVCILAGYCLLAAALAVIGLALLGVDFGVRDVTALIHR